MEWSKARVVDKYNWSCSACSKKVSIRDGSFFMPVKCELKVVIQAILSWCERTPVEVAANNLSEYEFVQYRNCKVRNTCNILIRNS